MAKSVPVDKRRRKPQERVGGVKFTLDLSPELDARLWALCKSLGVNKSVAARLAIDFYLSSREGKAGTGQEMTPFPNILVENPVP